MKDDVDVFREVTIRDLILELCISFKGWTWDYVLDLPVLRFWDIVSWLSERRQRENKANRRATQTNYKERSHHHGRDESD